MDEVRCTIWEVGARCAGESGAEAEAEYETVIGRGYKATGGGRRGLPMYDFRWTMYDCKIRAAELRAAEASPMYDGGT